MKLKALLEGVPVLETNVDFSLEIENVVYDTRKQITPGSLFVAIRGFSFDIQADIFSFFRQSHLCFNRFKPFQPRKSLF